MCRVLLYLYGVYLGVYIFAWVAFRDANVSKWDVCRGWDKSGVLALFLGLVIEEDLLLSFIFSF